jgi:hypothetical protein
MGPKLRRLNQGVHLPSGIEKERAGSLSRFIERFTFHVTLVKKGLGSPTRDVEQETSPFELNRTFYAEHCPYYYIQLPSALTQQLAIIVST